jgi:hypothetical protein
MGGALLELCVRVVSGASSGLSYNDYDNDNSNTNVSSHLCEKIMAAQTMQTLQKNTLIKRALVSRFGREDDL